MPSDSLFERIMIKLKTMLGIRKEHGFSFENAALYAESRELFLSQSEGDLEKMIFGHKGRIVHKWTHFPKIYQLYMEQFRGKDISMLEIGVSKGGSLQIWRKYLGEKARIAGIDIDPKCADLGDAPNRVFIGSQADPAFLKDVVQQIGGIDIVLDDGSHIAEHQEVSFRTLFPLLNEGGLYIIEDAHTAYWEHVFHGGYRRQGSAIEMAKAMVDDMHGWYHGYDNQYLDKSQVFGIHFYDSMIFIEKRTKTPPQHIELG